MSFSKSILFNTDSYKVSMWKQYPPNTTGVYSYIEARGGRFDQTVFFGLQAFIKEYLLNPITQDEIDLAAELYAEHGEPFNREGWEYILNAHGGFLPLRIRAVPEGSVVPIKNVLVTVENTDPAVPWLSTWGETAILRGVWYPTTVATQSWTIKQIILEYLERTGDPSTIGFKLHDFGARGVSSWESAGIGGAAHLVNFQGTDNVSSLLFARDYYGARMAGFSIPAAEHSTITSWGRENEVKAYANMLKQFAQPGSVVAVVSDSYDIYNAVENLWGGELREAVIASGATVVIRPDSGDPETVVSRVVQLLDKKFGSTVNEKGYKVLNNVRVIQGDGINESTIRCILSHLEIYGYSADNVAFGMGGALLQKVDRDTQHWAMKCSAAKIDGKWVPVQKDPVTDSGKRSKAGRVTLYRDRDGQYRSGVEDWEQDALQTVFENGRLLVDDSFDAICARSNQK